MKSFNIQYTYWPVDSELVALQQLVSNVPNTFLRWDEWELTVLHLPLVHGMASENADIETQWEGLCGAFGI